MHFRNMPVIIVIQSCENIKHYSQIAYQTAKKNEAHVFDRIHIRASYVLIPSKLFQQSSYSFILYSDWTEIFFQR